MKYYVRLRLWVGIGVHGPIVQSVRKRGRKAVAVASVADIPDELREGMLALQHTASMVTATRWKSAREVLEDGAFRVRWAPNALALTASIVIE